MCYVFLMLRIGEGGGLCRRSMDGVNSVKLYVMLCRHVHANRETYEWARV